MGVKLALHSQGLDNKYWDKVLRQALHSIRSLVCTATNCTPHERFFNFERKALTGHSLPSWIQDNAKALVRKHVRASKYDPWVEECEIITANPSYAEIRTASGKEQTVSLRDLAPLPDSNQQISPHPPSADPPPVVHPPSPVQTTPLHTGFHPTPPSAPLGESATLGSPPQPSPSTSSPDSAATPAPAPAIESLRRSSRTSNSVDRLEYSTLGGNN